MYRTKMFPVLFYYIFFLKEGECLLGKEAKFLSFILPKYKREEIHVTASLLTISIHVHKISLLLLTTRGVLIISH